MKSFSSTIQLLLITAATGIFSGCDTTTPKGEEKKETAKIASKSLALVSPVANRLTSTIRMPGELQAFQQVDLYAKVNSFVSQILVDVGSEVEAGQLLAVLDAPELKNQQLATESRLQSQQAIYMASKATYERLLQTSKTPGTISPNDLEQAYARQQADLAQLEAARATNSEISDMRNYLQIRAPFSGIITSRNVSTGAYVGPSGRGSELPMFTLVEHKKLRLVVSVPEAYSVNLNKSGEIKFTVAALPKDTLSAKIARASGALDSRLRSERIEADVPNKDRKLLPGMVADIIIPLQSDGDALTVPASTVLNSTLGTYVICVRNDKAIWVTVRPGITSNGVTEIIGQVSTEDKLVEYASEEIRNGSAVN